MRKGAGCDFVGRGSVLNPEAVTLSCCMVSTPILNVAVAWRL